MDGVKPVFSEHCAGPWTQRRRVRRRVFCPQQQIAEFVSRRGERKTERSVCSAHSESDRSEEIDGLISGAAAVEVSDDSLWTRNAASDRDVDVSSCLTSDLSGRSLNLITGDPWLNWSADVWYFVCKNICWKISACLTRWTPPCLFFRLTVHV